MKKTSKWNLFVFVWALAIGLLSACGPGATRSSPERYVDSQRNISHLFHSVVAFVQLSRETGANRSYCTGFYVNQNTIVSAAHCFERTDPALPFLEVPGRVGDQFAFRTWSQYQINFSHAGPTNTATITAIDPDVDVAVLNTNVLSDHSLTINTRLPRIGVPVFAVGHPRGLSWLLSEGIVMRLERTNPDHIEAIIASPPVFFGSSGGPLVNNYGDVVGITGALLFRQSVFGVFHPIQTAVTLQPNLVSSGN